MISVYFSSIFTKFLISDCSNHKQGLKNHIPFSRKKSGGSLREGFPEEPCLLEPSSPLALFSAAYVAACVSWEWLQGCATSAPLHLYQPGEPHSYLDIFYLLLMMGKHQFFVIVLFCFVCFLFFNRTYSARLNVLFNVLFKKEMFFSIYFSSNFYIMFLFNAFK